MRVLCRLADAAVVAILGIALASAKLGLHLHWHSSP